MPIRASLDRAVSVATAWLLRNGRQARAIWLLSGLCTLDGVLPTMPAEFMAAALMILQPHRLVVIALAFTLAAAASAGLLAAFVASVARAASWPSWLDSERLGPGWTQSVSLIQDWGAPVLAVAAVFPDSPRTTVAVAALAGLSPLHIAAFVLVGKAVLYGLLAAALRYGPRRRMRRREATWPGARRLQRPLRRLVALRRWIAMSASRQRGQGEGR
jgi:membrane protein YqaA with SNARE-associated domain